MSTVLFLRPSPFHCNFVKIVKSLLAEIESQVKIDDLGVETVPQNSEKIDQNSVQHLSSLPLPLHAQLARLSLSERVSDPVSDPVPDRQTTIKEESESENRKTLKPGKGFFLHLFFLRFYLSFLLFT